METDSGERNHTVSRVCPHPLDRLSNRNACHKSAMVFNTDKHNWYVRMIAIRIIKIKREFQFIDSVVKNGN